jgi:hypothetical protein
MVQILAVLQRVILALWNPTMEIQFLAMVLTRAVDDSTNQMKCATEVLKNWMKNWTPGIPTFAGHRPLAAGHSVE